MKVLIADDHPLVLDALTRTVRLAEPRAELLQATNFSEVEQGLRSAPDLALIDLHMPGMDGLAGIRRLRQAFPGLSMIVASGDDDPATIRAVLATGVAGFLPKSEAADVLLQAIRLVLSGGTYLPVRALGDFRNGAAPARPDAGLLTPRQLDVLRLLMRGEPNKTIARQLGLTEGTVKIHIAAVLRALQSRNRTEAAMVARAMGIEG